jgi:hypothetical protein
LTSGYVAACPRLTELTVLCPFKQETEIIPLDIVESVRLAISELIDACKTLPDFNTLQIVYLTLDLLPIYPIAALTERRNQALRVQVKDVKDWAIDCLKKPKTGRGKKKATLRVIELMQHGCRTFGLDSVKVEEYEVPGFDSKDLRRVQ